MGRNWKRQLTFKEFCKEYRIEIDYRIRLVSWKGVANNKERKWWIRNDKFLIAFAKAMGLKDED